MTDSMTSFLAIWGAVLGTIGAVVSVVLAVREFSKDKHQIKIQSSFCGEDPFWLIMGTGSENYVVINVVNIGFRPIQIKSVSLVLSDGKRIGDGKIIKDSLPKILEESQSIEVYFPVSVLRNELEEKKLKIKSALVVDIKGYNWKYRIPKSFINEHLTL